MVARRDRRKLGLHALPSRVIGSGFKHGRFLLRRVLVHRVVVDSATTTEFYGISRGPIGLLDGVSEEASTVGGAVARHLFCCVILFA